MLGEKLGDLLERSIGIDGEHVRGHQLGHVVGTASIAGLYARKDRGDVKRREDADRPVRERVDDDHM